MCGLHSKYANEAEIQAKLVIWSILWMNIKTITLKIFIKWHSNCLIVANVYEVHTHLILLFRYQFLFLFGNDHVRSCTCFSQNYLILCISAVTCKKWQTFTFKPLNSYNKIYVMCTIYTSRLLFCSDFKSCSFRIIKNVYVWTRSNINFANCKKSRNFFMVTDYGCIYWWIKFESSILNVNVKRSST